MGGLDDGVETMNGRSPARRARATARQRIRWMATALAVAVAAFAATAATAAADGIHHLDPSQYALDSFSTATSDMTAGARPDVSTTMTFKTGFVGDHEYPY